MYITKEDLKTVCPLSMVGLLTGEQDEIVSTIIEESIAKMKSYLSKNYDVDAIFDESKPKNLNIVKYLKDISIYEIYIRNTRDMNDVAQSRYDEAMDWLQKLNTGELYDETLPRKPKSESPSTEGYVRFGSNKKYESKY